MFSCLPISTLFPYTTLFRSGYIHLQLLPPFRSFQMHVEFRASCLFRLHSCDLEAGIPLQDHMNEVEKDMMPEIDRKSTRLNSSHSQISYAVFCLKKKKDKLIMCWAGPTRGAEMGRDRRPALGLVRSRMSDAGWGRVVRARGRSGCNLAGVPVLVP